MVVFQAVAWDARDNEGAFEITVFGRSAEGSSVAVSFPFDPYFFIKGTHKIADARCETVRAKTLWGFTNSELQVFTKVTTKTLEEFRKLASRARYKKLEVFEANIDPLLRFFHRSGIKPSGWLEAKGLRSFHTTCDLEFMAESWKDLTPVDREDLAPLRVASLDIECFSSTGSFPDPDVPGDQVFQIAVTVNSVSVCLSLGRADGCRLFGTERELLQGFKDLLMELDPDIVTGWNIFGFDLEYLYKRMILLKCDPDTFCWGRRREVPVVLQRKELASSALGQNVLKLVPMSGRYTFDLFQTIKAEHKLESYSLNNVSKEFLGESKHDMPIKELFETFRAGGDLTRVADYCKQDTALPLKLMKKLCTLENLIEMSKATWVPLSFLSERGQQIKVFSQISKAARELGFLIPSWVDPLVILKKLNPGKTEEELTRFEGATVLEAQTGAYFRPIVALDFASLYPSIMMAHNMCYSTLVMDPRYDNLPGVEYEQHGPYRFAQGVPSLLPKILADLKEFRKKAKKDMKLQPELESIYNGKQLAYKISMNSVYGFTGALKGMLSCLPIASSVTRKGREMIQASKDYVEAHFEGAKVRYGDSVLPGTPVLTRQGPRTIESLGSDWVEYPGFKPAEELHQKESSDCSYEVWTSSGWSKVKRVIRHKCKKRIFRVITGEGEVDVTEDHSLLGPNLEQIKPGEAKVGDVLYHSFPNLLGFWDDFHTYRGTDTPFLRQCKYVSRYNPMKPVDARIKSIEVLHESWDGYVYDLETEAGNFQAGVGQIIVKNTDSIMVEFPETDLDACWKLGERASEEITALFKKPNDLELEKIYWPYILYSKKRYAAKMWTEKNGKVVFDHIDIKGLQVVRRDNCEFVRATCQRVIEMLLESEFLEVTNFVEEQRETLANGNVPMDRLVLSKRLGSEYKNENLAHVVVRNKIRERAPGSEPSSGDRVQFVLVEALDAKGKPSKKMYEKAEDPDWVKEHNLKLDYGYYLKHQFETPVADLMEPLR